MVVCMITLLNLRWGFGAPVLGLRNSKLQGALNPKVQQAVARVRDLTLYPILSICLFYPVYPIYLLYSVLFYSIYNWGSKSKKHPMRIDASCARFILRDTGPVSQRPKEPGCEKKPLQESHAHDKNEGFPP